jgi:hypothetical protein
MPESTWLVATQDSYRLKTKAISARNTGDIPTCIPRNPALFRISVNLGLAFSEPLRTFPRHSAIVESGDRAPLQEGALRSSGVREKHSSMDTRVSLHAPDVWPVSSRLGKPLNSTPQACHPVENRMIKVVE